MYPTIENILKLKELTDCEVLTGSSGLSNQVRAVTIMDNPDITKWLNGGEILLTNGYMLMDYDEKTFLQFIISLTKKKVAALFIKLKRFIDELPNSIINFAAELGLPLVVIPNEYNWLSITTPINKYIIENQFYFVEKSVEIRDQLLKLIVKGRNISQICEKGSELLGKAISVYDENWKFISGSNQIEWINFEPFVNRKYLKKLDRLDMHSIDKYVHYLLSCELGEIIFVPLNYDFRTWGYIGITGLESRVQPLIAWEDTFKLDQLSILFVLEFIKERELKLLARRYTSDFLLELIDGVLTNNEEIHEKSSRLEQKLYEKYQLVVFECPSKINKVKLVSNLLNAFHEEEGFFQDIFTCERSNYIILFVPFIKEKGRTYLQETLDIVEQKVNEVLYYGVSTVHELTSMKNAYNEAQFSLFARNYTNRKIVIYDQLGPIRFFSEDEKRLNTPFILDFYKKNFQPLADYDKENQSELVRTLENLLNYNISIPETAKQLFIHENTLRARIKRIEKITNRSLKKPYDLFDLILGLILHQFLAKKMV